MVVEDGGKDLCKRCILSSEWKKVGTGGESGDDRI